MVKETAAEEKAKQEAAEEKAKQEAAEAKNKTKVTVDKYVCKRFTQVKVAETILSYDVGMIERFKSDQELNPLCWEKIVE